MEEISQLFQVLSPKEQREFVALTKQRNRRHDTKNLELLRCLANGELKGLDERLYPGGSKISYNMLRKRVKDNLIDFLASKAFARESSEEMDLLKLLLASRILFENGVHKVAAQTLLRAEKKAEFIDDHSILNEIFQTKIQYAHLIPNWNLKDIIVAYEHNRNLHQRDISLNLAYAIIRDEMKSKGQAEIGPIISRAFRMFSLELSEDLTYKSLYQLMVLTATAAKLQNDYHLVSDDMVALFMAMRSKGPVPRKYRYYYLNMLYLMALTDFRNKRFAISLARIAELHDAQEQTNKIGTVFDRKVRALTAMNHLYSGDIEKAEHDLDLIEGNSPNTDLALLMCRFQKRDYDGAYQLFKTFTRTDDWYEKKQGWAWVLKKNIIEILLLIELDRLELVLNRFERFSRNFSARLNEFGEGRVLVFMDFVKKYYADPDSVTTEAFEAMVERSFEWVGREQEDIFVMSFYAWLKSKMLKRPLYEVTLELVALEG
ncbi:MAG: hypothetical protein HRT65_02035 [Flavobacteriaceae bacterium]|nr:hypothetical protein [Flavobacteriaceae bacterium]